MKFSEGQCSTLVVSCISYPVSVFKGSLLNLERYCSFREIYLTKVADMQEYKGVF